MTQQRVSSDKAIELIKKVVDNADLDTLAQLYSQLVADVDCSVTVYDEHGESDAHTDGERD